MRMLTETEVNDVSGGCCFLLGLLDCLLPKCEPAPCAPPPACSPPPSCSPAPCKPKHHC